MVALTFLGAAGTVTGSRYLLEAGDERMMIDCGLFQGQKELRLQNWAALPVDPRSIQWLVLTHAHLDHTGYIPRLVKQGFRGPIVASPATADLTKLLLLDSAYLQEEDAAYANKMGFSKHTPALPLYTHEDALQSIELFHVVDETKPLRLSSHFTLRFLRAGHILGARIIDVTVSDSGQTQRVVFSGDVGRPHQLVIREPESPESADHLLLESTYGDRSHPMDDFRERLTSVIKATEARGGSLIVPAFAVGRTQELLYLLRELIEANRLPSLPIHVDSPMAIDVTDLYRRHHEDHNLQMESLEAQGVKPFSPPGVHFDRSLEESKALNDSRFPMIIISASGMATGGRVLHHLARCLPDPRNTVLLVGFQAPGTRGHSLQSGAPFVKMHGVMVPVRARIESMEHLSAHADAGEIMQWLAKFRKPPANTFLVHGEPHAAEALRQKITAELGWSVEVGSYLLKVPL
jgi:metallo-beta-lactamase family protein